MLDQGAVLDASLTKLGRMQTDRTSDWRDEQPGRIPYQVRRGPLARLDINPYSACYADFTSPLMFVISLAHLFSWTGDTECLKCHWVASGGRDDLLLVVDPVHPPPPPVVTRGRRARPQELRAKTRSRRRLLTANRRNGVPCGGAMLARRLSLQTATRRFDSGPRLFQASDVA